MFLLGLNPAYTPMVHMSNPLDLNTAIENAKQAESSYQFLAPPAAQPTSQVNSATIDALSKLTQQMETLSINFANATTTQAQAPPVSNSYPTQRNRGRLFDPSRPSRRDIECYKCGQKGHYA
jgi:hypothetical protein